MAILSGRFAEHTISPEKPPLAEESLPCTGPMVEFPSPVCTPSRPVTALNGCAGPEPDTKPACLRWCHHSQDSTVVTQAAFALLYVPATTPLPSPFLTAGLA